MLNEPGTFGRGTDSGLMLNEPGTFGRGTDSGFGRGTDSVEMVTLLLDQNSHENSALATSHDS